MRFSVDAHTIGCHLTGNEVYIRNLLQEYADLDRSSEIIAYVAKSEAPEHLPRSVKKHWVSANPYKRLGWDLPRQVANDSPDLLHVQYTGPLFTKVPLVVSLHDVSYLEHPEYFTRFRSKQLKLTVKLTVEKAARILTPSEFSKSAIVRHYGVEDEKVVVVPNAVSNWFRPMDRSLTRSAIERRMGVKGPFILAVGDLQPRKNHLGLLRAFEDVMRAHPKLKHRLLFVGKDTWYTPKVREAVKSSSVADRVHFAGFVDDADLVTFYNACDLFVYPSFYEGFGLPILEAMACGRAVACSNTTAMPEVADSAGLLFNPADTGEIGRAMSDILLDPELQARLERLGLQRAASFSWRRSAAQTMNVYYEVAGAEQRLEVALKAGVS
jgi:glycosyltransferase involved in cell wall biosynthesis